MTSKLVRSFVDDVYGFRYYVSLHQTTRGFSNWMVKRFKNPLPGEIIELLDSDSLGGVTIFMEGSTIVFWFPVDLQPGIVAHEAVHAMTHVFTQRHVSLSEREAAPYYVQFIVDKIYNASRFHVRPFELLWAGV